MDKYEDHKLIYDIIDQGVQIRQETIKLARLIDKKYDTPNSLQAMLGMIYRYEGETQGSLSQIYKRDGKNIIKYVTQLVERGLVEKVRDGKLKRLYLTEEGRAANEHFMKKRGELIEFVMEKFTLDELETTRRVLFEIAEHMNDYLESYESKRDKM